MRKHRTNRAGDQLHFIPFLGPVRDKFRTRAWKFPELVAYGIINRFFPWPQDASPAVAANFLDGFKMETKGKTKQSQYGLVASSHKIVTDYTAEYFWTYRKCVYCTPRSYLGSIDL